MWHLNAKQTLCVSDFKYEYILKLRNIKMYHLTLYLDVLLEYIYINKFFYRVYNYGMDNKITEFGSF